MIKFIAVFIFAFFASMEAKVMDHLKKAEGKDEGHSLRNIDYIYMINLDQRPEKFERSIDQLHPYGIFPYRFSALNGWEELTLEDINDVGVKFAPGMYSGFLATCYPLEGTGTEHEQRLEMIHQYGRAYFCGCLTRGAIGCALSHVSVLKDAYDSGYETIWVMEDDIHVVRDPTIIPDLIDELDRLVGKNGWDILFTDRDIHNAHGDYVPCGGMDNRPNFKPQNRSRLYINKPISKTFRRIGARFGATSMIVRRSGMKKILEFYEQYQLYHPYDMDFHLPEEIRLYTVMEDVITNISGAISDNGVPNYLKK